MIKLNYCPKCGKRTLKYIDNRKWACNECNFSLYNNVAAAVGLIIILEDDIKNKKILLIKRGKDPKKGKLAVPGGFVDPGESAEAAAKRECKEEIGLTPSKIEYLTSASNNYCYKEVDYTTCDIFFKAYFKNITYNNILDKLEAEDENEISGYVLETINKIDDIEKMDLAFTSAKIALNKLFN